MKAMDSFRQRHFAPIKGSGKLRRLIHDQPTKFALGILALLGILVLVFGAAVAEKTEGYPVGQDNFTRPVYCGVGIKDPCTPKPW